MFLHDSRLMEELQQRNIDIFPLEESAIQPASIDVRVSERVLRYSALPAQEIDVSDTEAVSQALHENAETTDEIVLEPGEFVLSDTIEEITVPDDVIGFLTGRSSMGRLGLTVHITAGLLDPGFSGTVTLEMKNTLSKHTLRIPAGQYVGQVYFIALSDAVERSYGSSELGSKYQDQFGPTPSRSD